MHFSFHRFILLLRMQFAVNRRMYLLGAAAIAGLLLVYMLFRAANATFGFEFDIQEENFELSLCFLSLVFGTMIFRQFGAKTRRVQALMLPVSALERFAVAFLMVFIVFPATYSGIYVLCCAVTNLADAHLFGHPNQLYVFNGDSEVMTLKILYLILPVVLLSAIWFRKLTFVKTVVMLCLPVLVFSFFNSALGKLVVNSGSPANSGGAKYVFWNAMPFESFAVATTGRPGMETVYNVFLPAGQQWIFTLFAALIPLLFLYLAYLKLREQEL
ncbi:hypothetical protein ACFOTA_20220 [Chitinophaga sp. GCM10012297]|uniref:ABC-2 family transporter protein n=1 Tax=Chitinophaga chungangae TaxID=2821488 RepID=A0ABS3YIN2_9BACT|nr:hypothetical protein [Chitinophaga chungangae]MBO9154550.1 hypothetical protein [Chitinophaga chungangae]